MEFIQFKEKLFTEARKAGFEDYQIHYSNRESLSINIYQGEVEKYSLNQTASLSFKGMINGKLGYSFTEILDEDAINLLINSAKAAALLVENDDLQFIYEGDKEYSKVKTYSKDLDSVTAEDCIKLALEMEKAAKDYNKNVKNFSGCAVNYTKGNIKLINSKGLSLEKNENILYAYVVPIVEIDGVKQDGMGYATALKLEDINPAQIAKEGVDEALSKFGGKSLNSGKYKGIIKNEAMVSLLSTFEGIFDADAVQKGFSLLKGKEGEIIASEEVTIIDDPLMDYGFASSPFDSEGVATYRKEVVSKGKLETFLHSLKTAYKAGVKSTGNGSGTGGSPSNFYIKAGTEDFDGLCSQIGDGVVITDFAGLHSGANSVSGDFSLAAKGFYVENGNISFPVEQITVSGNFFDLLKEIEAVGSDLKFPMSNIGSPSVIIKELSIAGK